MLSGIISVLRGQRWKPGMMRGPYLTRPVCSHGAPGLMPTPLNEVEGEGN